MRCIKEVVVRNFIAGVFIVLFFAGPVFAWNCGSHVQYGAPGQADQLLCRDAYAVGYSYAHKQPLWTAYHITGDSVSQYFKRSNKFQEDQDIPDQYRSHLSDYRGSGYDRGHMAPAATVDISEEAMQQSFLMSNMSPQLPGLNRGGWKYLEDYVRDWAKERGDLFVFTGPVFDSQDEFIGDGVTVPSEYYKVIYDLHGPGDAIAFIVPQAAVRKDDLPRMIVSVDDVEELTGLDFMNLISDGVEDIIENKVDHLW